MGYMTTVSILIDGLDQIRKHPQQLVDAIDQGMDGIHPWNTDHKLCCNSYGIGNHGNAVNVAVAHDANDPRLYLVHQNMMVPIGAAGYADIQNIELRKQVLETVKDLIRREELEIKKLEDQQYEHV